jgi:hypothetical protein
MSAFGVKQTSLRQAAMFGFAGKMKVDQFRILLCRRDRRGLQAGFVEGAADEP